MSRKSSGILLLLILIIAVAAAYFLYKTPQGKSEDLIAYIPQNTAFIIKVDEPAGFFRELAEENKVWRSLDTSFVLYRLLDHFNEIDSALKGKPGLDNLMLSHPLFAVITADSAGFSTFFIKKTSTHLNTVKLKSYLDESGLESDVEIVSNNMLKLVTATGDFFAKVNPGVLIFSQYPDVLENLTQRKKTQSNPSPVRQKAYEFMTSSAEKADARVFVHYGVIRNLPVQQFSPNGIQFLERIAHLAKFTEFDVKLKKEELLLSGFTTIDSVSELRWIRKQAPLPHGVINIIPFNTNLLVDYNFSEFPAYARQHKLTDALQIWTETGSELAMAGNAQGRENYASKLYAIIRLKNGDQSKQAFIKAFQRTGAEQSLKHGKFTLRKNKQKDALENTYGIVFKNIEANWFTFVEDYVVFAASSGSLENFLNMYETGKTLDLNENYKEFSDNVSSRSNLLIYFKPSSMASFSDYFLGNIIAEKLSPYKLNFSRIQAIALQFSGSGEACYSSFILKYTKKEQEENLASWKVELDEKVVGKPTLVWDHRTKTYNTVVFDAMSNMYLINARGQIQWKKRVDGPPVSELFEMDYYKNGKIQYLFNTRDFIYLIDRNGDFVKDYPIKLNPSATNGLNLFDYKKNKDYRMMIAQADKKVYNYTKSGKKVNGWNKPRTSDIVKETVYRIVADGKDYILISDISNNVLVVNRRGNKRFSLKGELKKARNSAFYANKTNSKGILLTTDEKGDLVYISSSGKLSRTSFGTFSPIHYFLYADFDADGSYDFLFLDGKELKVFDRFKNELFQYTFKSDINEKPVIFSLGRNRKALGVVSSEEKAIYLFDEEGNTIISRGLVGETPFTVGSIENNKELNLITASGHVIYNYRIR